jgi:hypothetical protein
MGSIPLIPKEMAPGREEIFLCVGKDDDVKEV